MKELTDYQHTTKSQVIYWVVLAAITATIIALPFVYVDISVQGGGVVRPVTEKTEIKAAITEYVDSVFVREGQQVRKGDVHPDMKRIVDLISRLGLQSFIERLPKGYMTYIGEHGTSLSGGERQRIANYAAPATSTTGSGTNSSTC